MTLAVIRNFGGFLIAITYDNRDTFISVVAWLLILYGAFGGYTSLSQFGLTVWLYPAPPVPIYLVTVWAVSLAFSVASLWCGLGLRRRDRSRLKALIFFLWLYIFWSVGMNVWSYIDHFYLSSSPETQYSELLESLERSARSRLANAISQSIRVVAESVIVVWVIGQLSSRLLRDEFE